MSAAANPAFLPEEMSSDPTAPPSAHNLAQTLADVSLADSSATPATTTTGASKSNAPEIKSAPAGADGSQDQVVTPWDVQGSVSTDGKQLAIDYEKLIVQFGTRRIDDALLQRFEKLTGRRPHVLLRRGMFFSHREFDKILDRYEQGKPFFLYTGRGPSSDSMHLGHMIPFVFTKWLQEVFDVPLVIQLTDDEKFLFKHELKIEQTKAFSRMNARDIIAVGVNLEKTFIFSNYDYAKATFGFTDSDNIGKIHFASIQAAPAFSNSFPQIFGTTSNIPASSPAPSTKIPTSVSLETLRIRFNKHGFSGGQETEEEHRRLGGNTEVDVAYQYLTFFLDDDEELERLGVEYRAGRLLTGQLKAKCIQLLQQFVTEFRRLRRAKVTDEQVDAFMDKNRKIEPTMGKAKV
ncbi:Nucleotidylyl transferase [Gymnopus androsaceus JB14]|uniref:tryptophan--tRNA ligase n=1 Tax=Gymnopus androsaceus JB14 TaxID=1447944 RepID=A0A6A4HIF3_9AGAR|nr:Nucleotidylyl transferase [Gymnopus androsaceus JB14]